MNFATIDLFLKAADVVRNAEALLITAGAGMGVDSGLPDFRGTEGFWNAYPAYRSLRLSFSQLANPEWFRRDPELAWGFYGHRLALYRKTVPHDGFAILRRWGEQMTCGVHAFTSNVDGQFQKAGFSSEAITEVHGSIHHLQCVEGCPGIWGADDVRVEVDPMDFRARGALPRCPACGGLARPNILMFDDDGWTSERTQTQDDRLNQWLQTIGSRRLVIIECGAGTAIPTVRMFSEYVTRRVGATLVRLNIRESRTEQPHVGLAIGALEGIRGIHSMLKDGATS